MCGVQLQQIKANFLDVPAPKVVRYCVSASSWALPVYTVLVYE